MKSTEIKFTAIPSTEEVKAERDRLAYRSRYGRVLRSTIYALVVPTELFLIFFHNIPHDS